MTTILCKSGYLTPERLREVDAVQERARQRERSDNAQRLLALAGIPKLYAAARLDDVEYARVSLTQTEFEHYCTRRDNLQSLLESQSTLILRGGNGPGKTHLACALVNAFCQACRPARFITAMGFFRELTSTFGAPGRTEIELFAKFVRYQLLVIDEYEVRSEKEWHNNQLRDLINERDQNLVSTVLITNKSLDEINSYFPTAVRDRIRRTGAVLNCDWRSLRGRK